MSREGQHALAIVGALTAMTMADEHLGPYRGALDSRVPIWQWNEPEKGEPHRSPEQLAERKSRRAKKMKLKRRRGF